MPRQARQESATGYYHVMMRGINREFIFRYDRAKRLFLQLLTEQQTDGAFALVAWCVMDNHVHLLLKADISTLSKAVKVICLRFAAYYNGSHDRIGPVFGDRYKSENIEDDAYLLGALRYIHLNPVKARLAPSADSYAWSSYTEYLDTPRLVDKAQREFIL